LPSPCGSADTDNSSAIEEWNVRFLIAQTKRRTQLLALFIIRDEMGEPVPAHDSEQEGVL